jgi:hypothetical protein
MRYTCRGPILAGLAAVLLIACSSGGEGNGGQNPNNVPPTANAGAAQTVTAGDPVTLNGSASSDPDGSIATYAWTQSGGTPAVTLSNPAIAQPTFTAPSVTSAATLTFSLTVTDNRGATSPASTVTITVNPAVTSNTPPTANAGAAQTVPSGATVTLNGSASSDPDGTIATYAWSQTGGTPVVTLSDPAIAQPTFLAPTVTAAATLTFSLIVTDNQGAISAASTVTVTVNPPTGGNVTVTGTIRFQRVPFSQPVSGNNGLNFAAQVLQPARGIVVRVIDGTTQNVLVTGATNDNGVYSLSVPSNSNIRIQAVAQMLRGTSSPLPRWNFRVLDADQVPATPPYEFTEPTPFNSGSGGTHDVAIPSGLSTTGAVTGTRASAPFAILDTVFQAVQTVLSVAPNTNFPSLILDWAEDNPGGETFYDSGIDVITLSANPSEDTDEFDQHVIAHEFGHYVEDSFSRADNIGGAHGRGDKLDIRVAFGEGFGYAFSAIVLNDPVARDSFVVSGTQRSSNFNVETNPPTDPVGAPLGDYGCFCSESSVWSILWDLYDPVADGADTLSLGFAPLWNVLINEQRTTASMTSIFSFIAALKAALPANATAIDQLLLAQNIDPVVDAFATGESNFPTTIPSSAVLPIYTTANIAGGPVIVFTTDDGGTFNMLGNRRFIRFNVASVPRTVTITASSSNTNSPDTDFVVYRNGVVVAAGLDGPAQNPETETFSVTQTGTYIIDVYDCANGCGDQGTPGDYNLTVTIN